MNTDELVEIYIASNNFEAQAIADMLKSSGIESQIISQGLHSFAGGLPIDDNIKPRIIVRKKDEIDARWIITENKSKVQKIESTIDYIDKYRESAKAFKYIFSIGTIIFTLLMVYCINSEKYIELIPLVALYIVFIFPTVFLYYANFMEINRKDYSNKDNAKGNGGNSRN